MHVTEDRQAVNQAAEARSEPTVLLSASKHGLAACLGSVTARSEECKSNKRQQVLKTTDLLPAPATPSPAAAVIQHHQNRMQYAGTVVWHGTRVNMNIPLDTRSWLVSSRTGYGRQRFVVGLQQPSVTS